MTINMFKDNEMTAERSDIMEMIEKELYRKYKDYYALSMYERINDLDDKAIEVISDLLGASYYVAMKSKKLNIM